MDLLKSIVFKKNTNSYIRASAVDVIKRVLFEQRRQSFKLLRQEKAQNSYGAKKFVKEFPNKNWCLTSLRKMDQSGTGQMSMQLRTWYGCTSCTHRTSSAMRSRTSVM